MFCSRPPVSVTVSSVPSPDHRATPAGSAPRPGVLTSDKAAILRSNLSCPTFEYSFTTSFVRFPTLNSYSGNPALVLLPVHWGYTDRACANSSTSNSSYNLSIWFSLRQFSVLVNCAYAPSTSNLRARRNRLQARARQFVSGGARGWRPS